MASVVTERLSLERALAPSPGALLMRKFLGHRSFVLAGGALVLIILMAICAPLVAPHDPYAQDLTRRRSGTTPRPGRTRSAPTRWVATT
jgi:peptide/nickel transport system permease protein